MRVPMRGQRAPVSFNLTAMIDVVFNLIVFFLVASHFSRSQMDAPVNLPAASQAGASDDDPRRLTITVTSTGGWSVAGKPATLTDLENMIKEGAGDSASIFSVHIRGDREAPYRFIEPLLLASAKAKVTTVRFNVIQP